MIWYITDNPYFKKNYNPTATLLYQIFNWKVFYDKDKSDIDYDHFTVTKTHKRKAYKEFERLNNELIAVVAESNYKLMYEITQLQIKKKNVYLWHKYRKREKYPLARKHFHNVKYEFERYLKRGYFSRAIYDKLAYFNLQRIEQLLVLIALNEFRIKGSKEHHFSNSTDKLLNAILSRREEAWYAIEKLIYHSRKLDITDPFTGSFEFLNKNNSLYKLYKGRKDSDITGASMQLCYIVSRLKDIVPYVDILKTIRYMEKNGTIRIGGDELTEEIVDNLDIYLEYLKREHWESYYHREDYSLSMFPSLDHITELYFVCPECNGTDLRETPLSFYCPTYKCPFSINRVIKAAGKQKSIAEKDLLRMLKHGSTIIKNANGGYNRFFLEKRNNRYVLFPYISKNDINPDKGD